METHAQIAAEPDNPRLASSAHPQTQDKIIMEDNRSWLQGIAEEYFKIQCIEFCGIFYILEKVPLKMFLFC